MKPIVAAYVTDRSLPLVTAGDARRMTRANIAFALVREDRVVTGHLRNTACLEGIRRANPDIELVLSVGGWGAGGFSEAAATPQGRRTFAETAAGAVQALRLDGIDIDWEYPCIGVAEIACSPADRENFTLLLRALRGALDALPGSRKLLTIAAGADQYFVDGTSMEEAQQALDAVQLMTYDMRGGFQTMTGHHTNLYASTGDLFRISAAQSVEIYVKAGVPREKIIIGAAFYSRKWTSVPDRNNGLFQMTAAAGGYGARYSELVESYIGKNGYARHWDDEACAPWLFNGDTFFSYDDERSVACKCDYVRKAGLAGIMYWEHGGDATGALLKTMHDKLSQ